MPRRVEAITLSALIFAFVFALIAPRLVHAQVTIADPSSFDSTLKSYNPGSKVLLKPGLYKIWARDIDFFSRSLVVKSADPHRPARFRLLNLRHVNGVTFKDVLFHYSSGDEFEKPFTLEKSNYITFERVTISADPDADGFGRGFGLNVSRSSHISVKASHVSGFYRGLVFHSCDQLQISDSLIENMSSDGLNFAQVQNVVLANNIIRDFRRAPDSGAHPDMIQFWTNRTTRPSRNIKIQGNLLWAGSGQWSQSIFMRNEKVDSQGAGPEMFYQDILIEENLIINAHLHGITVGETDGLIVRRNTLVHQPSAAEPKQKANLSRPQIRVKSGSRNVAIIGNAAHALPFGGSQPPVDWLLENNLKIQDQARMKPGFYSRIFSKNVLLNRNDPLSYSPAKGGPLDNTGVGVNWPLPVQTLLTNTTSEAGVTE